jgi:hypothetical protein
VHTPVPHTGQTFGTKEEEKSYYNAYAKRIGFSIRISATRLSTSSRQQRKVVFVCNKERKKQMITALLGLSLTQKVMLTEKRLRRTSLMVEKRG